MTELTYTDETGELPLAVVFSRRRSVAIRLKHGDPTVYVSAPAGIKESDLLALVGRKRGWIRRKREELERSAMPQRRFTDGSEHSLLGQPFILRIETGKTAADFSGNTLTLTLRKTDEESVRKALYRWYAAQAEQLIPPVIAPLMSGFSRRHRKMPSRIEYKHVRSYWGQCTGDGLIRLNIELVRAPQECIEMIFIHELCHLIHKNHSARFYGLLDNERPNWRNELLFLRKNYSCRF